MSIGTKLKTVYDGCSDIRAAIKEKDSTKGSGAIGTLANDISTLYPDSVITKIYQDDTTGEYGMVQNESTTNSITSTVLTTNVPEGATVKAIILPQTVTSIAANSFTNKTALEYINLENITVCGASSNTGDANGAFYGCTGLKTIRFSKPVTLYRSTFMNCKGLKEVNFDPNLLVTVQANVFKNCTGLTSIGPMKIKFSNAGDFQGCTGLTTVDMSTSTWNTCGYDTSSTQNNGDFQNCTNLTTVILPSTCTTIGQGCFRGCTKLNTVNRLNNLTAIKTYGFYNTRLTGELNAPNMTMVASYACYNCKFTRIILPAIIESNGTPGTSNSGSFSNITTLTYAEFGPNCTKIGYRTFQNCSALTTFVCRAETPPTLQTNVFTSTNSALKIYVPYSADQSIINAYKAASNWSAQSSKIYELNEDRTVPTA